MSSMSWKERIAVWTLGSVTLGITFMLAAYTLFAFYAGQYILGVGAALLGALALRSAKKMIEGHRV